MREFPLASQETTIGRLFVLSGKEKERTLEDHIHYFLMASAEHLGVEVYCPQEEPIPHFLRGGEEEDDAE